MLMIMTFLRLPSLSESVMRMYWLGSATRYDAEMTVPASSGVSPQPWMRCGPHHMPPRLKYTAMAKVNHSATGQNRPQESTRAAPVRSSAAMTARLFRSAPSGSRMSSQHAAANTSESAPQHAMSMRQPISPHRYSRGAPAHTVPTVPMVRNQLLALA